MKKALSFLGSRRFFLVATAIAMTITYCIFPSPFYLVLPLYNTLFVGMLISAANRYSFLIGGINSFLYTVTYISIGIYMQAFQAFFFSCLLSFVTFFTWSKRAYKNSTVFRRMTKGMYLAFGGSFLIVYLAAITVLTLLGSKYVFLDTFTSLGAILATVLYAFSFREAPLLHAFNTIFSIFLSGAMVLDDPTRWPFLISSIYSAICVWRSIFVIWKLYKEQQSKAEAEQQEQNFA